MKGLTGKRFIIGGGATGIGAALATRLIEEGASVAVGDVNEPKLKALATDLAKKGDAIGVLFDLADEASINALVKRAVDEFGGLDGLAIPGADLSKATMGNDHPVIQMDPKIWERTFKINVIGHALLMKAAIPHLVKSGGGSIVTISSAGACMGMNVLPAYSASKAALQALTRHVARLAGKDRIRCNAVAPGGFVSTEGARVNTSEDMIADSLKASSLPRLGEPDDIASMMAFLLSDEAPWITGQVISVNGGSVFRD